jgi:hypothetical protein
MVPLESSCHKEHIYKIPITYHSKDMANVKVFKKWIKLQGQGHKVKDFGTNRKVLSQGTHIRNMKALSLAIQKTWPVLKVFEKWVKLQGHKVKKFGTNRKVLS